MPQLDNLLKYKGYIDETRSSTLENRLKMPLGSLEVYISKLISKFKEKTSLSYFNNGVEVLTDIFTPQEITESLESVHVGFIPGMLLTDFLMLDEKRVTNMVRVITNQWIDLAIKNDVDISKEKLILETFLIKLKENFSFFNELQTEIKIMNQDLKEISDAEKSSFNTVSQGLSISVRKKLLDENHIFKKLVYNEENNQIIDSLNIEKIAEDIQSKVITPIINKIKEQKTIENAIYSDAERFLLSNDAKNIETEITFSKSQKVSSLVVFKDNSMIYEGLSTNHKYKEIKTQNETKKILSDAFNSYIEFKLRKKPKYISVFKGKYQEEENLELVGNVINKFLENEDILKQYYKDDYQNIITDTLNEKSLEGIDDVISDVIRKHKVIQYAHSIASNKYRYLYNEETYTIVKELYDLNLTQERLQSFVGKKIASFTRPEQFNESLQQLLNQINNFDIDSIKEKAESYGALVVLEDENTLVLKIEEYNQSKNLGSPSWCIVRNSSYFEDYLSKGHQYFIYDFKKSSKDDLSMIGITLLENGEYYTAHIKNDDSISKDNINDFYIKIVSKEFENFVDVSNKLKDEVDDYNNKIKETNEKSEKIIKSKLLGMKL